MTFDDSSGFTPSEEIFDILILTTKQKRTIERWFLQNVEASMKSLDDSEPLK